MDYRCTPYCTPIKNVNYQKEFFLNDKVIIGKYTNIYNLLLKKDIARHKFDSIYESKCAYCGVNFSALEYPLFEIDHFNPSDPKDNTINNLVLSCYKCNRSKSDYFDVNFNRLFHPDFEKLSDIFERDIDFTIKIKDKYLSNLAVIDFYNRLQMGSFVRQLDYLLSYICDSINNKKHSDEVMKILLIIKDKLRFKRSILYKK